MIRILIADDHAIMREGLKHVLHQADDFEVVGEADNGVSLMQLMRSLEIDLLLLDMNMPGLHGETLITRLHAKYPHLPILVLSMHNEPQIAQRALRAGASGYLTKDRGPDILLTAVRRVSAGERYLDDQLALKIALHSSGLKQYQHLDHLSNREFQIMRLLASGHSVNEIAAQLMISNKTVSTHKAHLMEKMGFDNNADLIRYSILNGFD
ncbi:response regulator [Aquipseudomonas campi]